MRVAITDHPFPSMDIEEQLLGDIGAEIVRGDCTREEDVLDLCREADAILVTYAPVTSRVVAGLTKCRIIARYGIGVDNVDVPAASQRGIVVTNVPDYCVDEVSDHALALLLACARKIVSLNRLVHEGTWDYRPLRPFPRLRGKTVGLLGYGKIARALASKVVALGMCVVVYDPYVPAHVVQQSGLAQVDSVNELCRESDFLSLHVPLVPETRGIVGDTALGLMKKTAFVINTSRAGIVDEAALTRAIQGGRIAGAGLDFLSDPTSDNPLLQMPQVVITPHAAFYSEESTEELQRRAVGEVVRVLAGKPPLSPVKV